jgi:hypothetical protein
MVARTCWTLYLNDMPFLGPPGFRIEIQPQPVLGVVGQLSTSE